MMVTFVHTSFNNHLYESTKIKHKHHIGLNACFVNL
jgi:hypothetical protein